MRVLHVITGLRTGGAEHMLLKLLAASPDQAGDRMVVSLTDKGAVGPRLEALGIGVVSLGMRRLPDPLSLVRLARRIDAFAPDVVQGWMYHGNIQASLARPLSRSRAPVAWTIRQTLYDRAAERRLTRVAIRLGALLSRRAAAIVYNSELSARQHEAIGYDAARRAIIPNGFDCERFRPMPEARAQVRAALGIAAGVPLVGLVARYHPMKDHRGFLKAAAIVARRYPAVHFLLAGAGLEILAESAELRALGDRVLVLGERSDMPSLTAALDIACSASARGEGFSNALGEAMATAVPCVATAIGASGELIGDTGVLVPPSDPAALAAGIMDLLAVGETGRRALGEAARLRVVQRFALADVARRYDELWRGLCRAGT